MNSGKIHAIVALFLSFFILPNSVRAYSGGSGDPNNPYQIASAADLLYLAAHTTDYNKCFILTADINLASSGTFTTAVIAPDVNNANSWFDGTDFTGVFDGNGHKISNLTIDTNGVGNDCLGLFGQIGSVSEIKNLRLENVNITGGDNSFYLGGLTACNEGSISNCFSAGNFTGGDDSVYLGGLVGYNTFGEISNCCSTGTVTGTTNLGGLLGNNGVGSISNCYSTGTVTGTTTLGGLVGYNNGGNISNCYSTDDVNGIYYLGGLVGDNRGNISNCYSTGNVNGTSLLGGLVGYNNGGNISNCFFLTGSGPDNNVPGATPLTDAQMKQQSSFIGWDFIDIWYICEDSDYPRLVVFSSEYSGGSGTADCPYRIANADDLLDLAADANDYDKYFILISDIDLDPNLPGNQVFTTAVIAPDTVNSNYEFEGTAFTGVFNGNGLTISNLTIDTGGAENDFLGLFGEISSGEIKNLALENVNITGGNDSCWIGGLVGFNAATIISNCHSTATVSSGDGADGLGGLAGRNDAGSISNCYSTGNVNGLYDLYDVGGLVGYNEGGGTISYCHSTGNVTGGDGSGGVGGLVGFNDDSTISSCCSTGNVIGGEASYELGGLVGYNQYSVINNSCSMGNVTGGEASNKLGGLVGSNNDGSSLTISNCFSTGNVTGGDDSYYLGGLVGFSHSSTISNSYSRGNVTGGDGSYDLGGLMGYNSNSDINKCYSTGDVNGASNLGGLVGTNNIGTISGCYFLITSGPNNVPGATPLTDAQMKQQASFVGWDFVGEIINGPNDIWWIKEKVTYPKLTWQLNVTKCTVTAGKKADSDKIAFSGDNMYATADDFNDANVVKVTIVSNDMVSPCVQTFPIDEKSFKNGKYNYARTENASSIFFKFDLKTRKFSFSAKNVDLSGLSCPLIVQIEIGDYCGTAVVDEALVNGPKALIPIQLMMGVKDILSVSKCTVKQGKKKPNSDQLTVSGGFIVANPDPNMAHWITEDLVITLGAQTFTVPAANLKTGKGKFSCTKAVTDTTSGGDAGVVAATFDFNKCSFTLTIKNTEITATGDVDFGVSFAAFDETDNVTLP